MAGVLLVAEMLTATLYLAPFAASAALAAVLSALGVDPLFQVAAFVIVGILLVFAFRPLARRHQAAPALTGTDALVGAEGVALTEIGPRDGRVKVPGGEWSARSEAVIAEGQSVVIAEVKGATLTVKEK